MYFRSQGGDLSFKAHGEGLFTSDDHERPSVDKLRKKVPGRIWRIRKLPVEVLIIEAKSSGANPKEIPNSIPSAIATWLIPYTARRSEMRSLQASDPPAD